LRNAFPASSGLANEVWVASFDSKVAALTLAAAKPANAAAARNQGTLPAIACIFDFMTISPIFYQ
jgi:hypothetical protein